MWLNEGLEKLGAKSIISGIEYEGGVFYKAGVENIRIPSTVKRIEGSTFYGCRNLQSIELPTGVEYIGDYCFHGSGITEIVLPNTL